MGECCCGLGKVVGYDRVVQTDIIRHLFKIIHVSLWLWGRGIKREICGLLRSTKRVTDCSQALVERIVILKNRIILIGCNAVLSEGGADVVEFAPYPLSPSHLLAIQVVEVISEGAKRIAYLLQLLPLELSFIRDFS